MNLRGVADQISDALEYAAVGVGLAAVLGGAGGCCRPDNQYWRVGSMPSGVDVTPAMLQDCADEAGKEMPPIDQPMRSPGIEPVRSWARGYEARFSDCLSDEAGQRLTCRDEEVEDARGQVVGKTVSCVPGAF